MDQQQKDQLLNQHPGADGVITLFMASYGKVQTLVYAVPDLISMVESVKTKLLFVTNRDTTEEMELLDRLHQDLIAFSEKFIRDWPDFKGKNVIMPVNELLNYFSKNIENLKKAEINPAPYLQLKGIFVKIKNDFRNNPLQPPNSATISYG